MLFSGVYVVRVDATSFSTARTMVQVNAAATRALALIRAWVSFSTTTSAAIDVRIKQVTTAGTPTSTPTPIRIAGESTPTAAAGINYTAEGTLGDVYIREYINQLNNFLYLPVPEERIIVAPSGRLALEFGTAPAAVTVTAGMVFGEMG